MRTLVIVMYLMSLSQVSLACDSFESCAEEANKSRWVSHTQAYATLATAYAIEDVAKAIRESAQTTTTTGREL